MTMIEVSYRTQMAQDVVAAKAMFGYYGRFAEGMVPSP